MTCLAGRGRALRRRLFQLAILALVAVTCHLQNDGTDPMPVYPTIDCYPEWSPAGSTISFSHLHLVRDDTVLKSCPESTGLWFIRPDGSDMRLFSNRLPGVGVKWSPDGRWLLFVKDHTIWRIHVSGDSLTRVLSDSGGRNYHAAWSPDGRSIAVERVQDDKQGIWTMPASGGHLRYVGHGCMPDWSPDGRRIAYYVLNCIGIVDTNGTNDRRLLTAKGGSVASPAFSPDGSKIAFGATMDGKGGLYVIDTTGRSLRMLAKHACLPSWSPDGREIVFVGHGEVAPSAGFDGLLYVMCADGSGRRQLTFGPDPSP